MKKLVSATVSAALCMLSITPAVAQDYRFAGFEAPRGATATANLRIPLGREAKSKPSYGFTLGYGKSAGAGLDGRTVTRAFRLADLRFSPEGKLGQARLVGFDLADPARERRMKLTGGMSTTWLIVGAVAGAVAVCMLAECFEGDDDDAVPN
jgi:hypothetical protein